VRRYLPKSLAGQIALLVAAALFVAQAINFGLLLNERRNARFAQVIVPTVTRLADATERLTSAATEGPARSRRGRDLTDQRGRIRLHDANPVDPAFARFAMASRTSACRLARWWRSSSQWIPTSASPDGWIRSVPNACAAWAPS
jgi:hypothetical protein